MSLKFRKLYKISIITLALSGILFLVIKKSDSQFNDTSKEGFLDSKSDAPHDVTCASCHMTHNSADVQLTSVAGNANLCISCHNSAGTASALPFATSDIADPSLSTGNSHAWNKSAVNATYETNTPSNTEMAARIYSGNIVCSTCHDQHSQTYSPFLRTDNTGDVMCKDCHSARNVGRYSDDNTNHIGSHPVGLVYDGSNPKLNATPTSPLQLVGSNIECSSCHQTHYASTSDGNLLRATNNNSLCTSCHTYGPHQGFSCDDCHLSHNPVKDNIYMIKDIVNGSEVNFYAETGVNSFGDEDGTEDGICEVCHTGTLTDYHRSDGSGASHNPETNCTTCHLHSNEFDADCTTCHQDNFPGWKITDGHYAHAEKYDFACSTCHFGNNHDDGTADVAFNPNGLATRNGQDANTPSWNSSTCSNIYCHSNGRTAYRGEDANYTWSGTIGSQTATYTTTPAWSSTVGTINTCTPCHSGNGNMTSDYLITSPFVNANPPSTGAHRRGVHIDNDQDFNPYNWASVQCFWCHNTDGASADGPNYQGTYGTSYHVDGQTHFDPRSFDNGGTYAIGMSYSAEGNHCGSGRSCW